MKLVQRSLFGVACLAALLACNNRKRERDGDLVREAHDQSGAPTPPGDRVGTTTITSSVYGGIGSDIAVGKLVASRCARETACNNVGPDRRFVDPDICTHELSERIGMDLKPSTCPRGVDAAALENCLDAIRNESCNNPVETVERLATCRTSEMCVKR